MSFAKQLPRLIINALISLIAALGVVFCVTTAFDLAVDYWIISMVGLISAILFSACFLQRRYWWLFLLLGIVAAAVAFAAGLFAPAAPTVRQLAHDILTRFSSAYPNLSFAIPPEPEGYLPQDVTLVFSLLTIAMSVWMAWGVGYRSSLITVAGTLPFLLLCVIINDTPPHALSLVMLLAAWLTILLCRERPGEPVSMEVARLGITLMAVALVLLVIATLYPKEDTRDRELPALVQSVLDHLPAPMQDMLSRNSIGPSADELGADTSDILDLTQQGTRNRTDTVMLQVSSSETGVLYLRGAAKDVYTGSSWESRDEASPAQSLYAQTSLGASYGGSLQAAIQVRSLRGKSSVAFVPYGFISCTGAEDIASDLRIDCFTDDYIDYYWPELYSLDLSAAGSGGNTDYDAYVKNTCLSLPADTRDALYALAMQYGYDPSLSTLETVAWVAEFVRTVGTYQLDVSRQPTNYDFAVYFLTESKAGYCVHFATAAAAVYRALGVPARYASGYRVTISEPGSITDVADKDTHAWAEVYLEGFGWIPIEATPGFGSTVSLPEVSHTPEPMEDAPTLSYAPEPSPSPIPAGAESEPSPAVPSEAPDGAGISEPPADSQPPPPGGSGSGNSAAGMWFWFLPPGILLLLLLLLPLRRRIVTHRRYQRFHTANLNQSVIRQWQYLERLIPWGAQPTEELEALALKAKFSQHHLTDGEHSQFSFAAKTMAIATAKQLSPGRRLRFKWLHCLDWPRK